MSVIITRERPDTFDAISLIPELEAVLELLYPPESHHEFSLNKLLAEDVAFFRLRVNETSACWGRIKLVGREYGEIKRMYVRPQFRGLGFSKLMLNHLADYAHPCSQHYVAAFRNWNLPARSNRALRAAGLVPHSPVRAIH